MCLVLCGTMKQKPVKSKVVGKLLERYGIEVSKKDTCVICESDIKYLMINNKISFFYYHLQMEQQNIFYKQHLLFHKY